MKSAYYILILLAIFTPVLALARESLTTDRFQAFVEDTGNWQLTDNGAHITWQGQWLPGHLMKVTGSDDSCFIIGENADGMIQLDCRDLTQVSVLLSYQK